MSNYELEQNERICRAQDSFTALKKTFSLAALITSFIGGSFFNLMEFDPQLNQDVRLDKWKSLLLGALPEFLVLNKDKRLDL